MGAAPCCFPSEPPQVVSFDPKDAAVKDGEVKVFLEFDNSQNDQAVRVCFAGAAGELAAGTEKLYMVLGARQSYIQQSYGGHVWRVYDANNLQNLVTEYEASHRMGQRLRIMEGCSEWAEEDQV